ncbi:hypothetical protein CEXT_54261 [Caerostris extrusa]|uniref:Uncharacterized protein n=1 Tax=Caerostris extrusa TaxID=172846 RepID=A0AAV4QP82_CAEEX|nr:hypothetical protein CEXT_54261 [Caerostris extrusa]
MTKSVSHDHKTSYICFLISYLHCIRKQNKRKNKPYSIRKTHLLSAHPHVRPSLSNQRSASHGQMDLPEAQETLRPVTGEAGGGRSSVKQKSSFHSVKIQQEFLPFFLLLPLNIILSTYALYSHVYVGDNPGRGGEITAVDIKSRRSMAAET